VTVRLYCGQDKAAVSKLQKMLQQLQTDVKNTNNASQRVSDDLNSQRSEVEVTLLFFSLNYLQAASFLSCMFGTQ